jgi:hypothetical protein
MYKVLGSILSTAKKTNSEFGLLAAQWFGLLTDACHNLEI